MPPRRSPTLTPITFHLLLSLTREPMHGYGLKHDVEERTGGGLRVTPGTLYAGLQRMEREGLIRETKAPVSRAEEAGTRWRFYAITPVGRRRLEEEVARLERDVRAARALLPRAEGA